MNKLARRLFPCLLAIMLAFACHARAAGTQENGPASFQDMGGATVSTKFFSVTLPPGWTMPVPVRKDEDSLTAIFGTASDKLAVTINAFKADGISPRELADATLANMRKEGYATGDLAEKDGMLKADVTGVESGVAWFGENAGILGATMILGADEAGANEFLKGLKPIATGIFPSRMN